MSQAALDALEHYAFSGEEGANSEDTPPGTTDVLKRCCRCKTLKSLAEFSIDNNRCDGKCPKCKQCQKEYNRVGYIKRKREDAQDDCEKEEEQENEPGGQSDPDPGSGDLYVMQNSRIPGELKVGRSQDVEARRRSLQSSHNFRMLVLAVFPGAGNIEGCVHEMLSYCRVTEEAAGREWFRCSPQIAFFSIGQALGESRFAATSAGSSA